MNKHLLALSVIAAASGSPALAEEAPDAQYQALEARLAQLEARDATATATSALDKIKINGFLSAGFGWADTADGQSYDTGLNSTVTHTADSVAGLQVEAQVNERTRAVMQLVGRGTDDFDAGLEWAYVSWRPTEADELRAGRMRASFYMLSEYIEVGYAYPWARPPAEVYQADFPTSFDGLSWLHKINAGAWQHEVRANWGSTKSPAGNTSQLDAEDAWTLGLMSSHGDWQFGGQVSNAQITAQNPLFQALAGLGLMEPISRADIDYAAIGGQYDNGKLVLMAEATRIEIEGVLPDSDNAYATIGYRFGKVMPHLTYATTSIRDSGAQRDIAALPALCPAADPNPDASLCLAIVPNTVSLPPPTTVGIPFPADTLARMLEAEQDSVTLGVRYDFLPNAALKVDWTRVLDTHGTMGLFSADDGNVFYAALPEKDIDAFRVVVDVVF